MGCRSPIQPMSTTRVGQIEAQEAEMNSMIEDEERLLLIEFKNNNWFSHEIEAR